MMGPNGKPKLGIAIGLVGPKKKEPEIDQGPLEGEESDGATAELTAMQSFMDELQSGDAQSALSAYKHLRAVCKNEETY